MLVRHEGLRLKPYTDSVGKLTIGVGRNLDDVGISRDEAMALLDADIDKALAALMGFSWFSYMDETRQAALADMVFNVGLSRFLCFSRMIAAIEREDWAGAARELLDSAYAKQVGARAVELADQLHTGVWSDVA
jgi:lysozyme